MNNIKSPESHIQEQDILFSTTMLAKLIGRKPQTIRKWISEDKYPDGLDRPSKINKRNVWHRDSINKFISHLKNK